MSLMMHIPSLTGSASNHPYEGWIELSCVHAHIQQTTNHTVGMGTMRETGIPEFSTLCITKQSDSASNGLFQMALQAQCIPKVCIHTLVHDQSLQPRLIQRFYDVMITSFDETGSSFALSTELLQLSYLKVERTYLGDDNGDGQKKPDRVAYDLSHARLC